MEIKVTAILLQILNFSIVLAALTFLLMKPIKRILNERSTRVAEGQKAAEEALAEKASIAELKKKADRQARSEAKKIMTEARKEADAKRTQWLDEAKQEVIAMRAKAEKSLESERAKLAQSMQADFEEAVFAVAQKVIGQELSAKQHSSLIKQGLKDIASAK